MAGVPPSAIAHQAERAGEVRDHAVVKRRKCKGSVEKSLFIEIVRVVFTLLSDNARVFLQECQRARGLPAAGHLHSWAAPSVGRVGPKLVYFFREK